MLAISSVSSNLSTSGIYTVCSVCRLTSLASSAIRSKRTYSAGPVGNAQKSDGNGIADKDAGKEEEKEASGEGALSRRLKEMAEEAVYDNPALARKVASGETPASDVGFSQELRAQLEERLKDAEFASKHAAKISVASAPSYASSAARHIAESAPWTGEESPKDIVNRMLQDAHKPLPRSLRGSPRTGVPVDMRIRGSGRGPAHIRIARAREASLDYTLSNVGAQTEEEKAERKKILAERFEPTARPVASIRAVESLAEQRIVDAYARGEFKNLPKGASTDDLIGRGNPFVDTTEYFLNRIIQRQEIVPPWIEKQHELNREVETFRASIRGEWMRFCARRFSAKGGVEEGLRRAEENLELENKGEGYRDKEWEGGQMKSWELAMKTINDLCRSYNLLAPDSAKKPYFDLRRELDRAYKETAPHIAGEIRARAERHALGSIGGGKRGGGAGGVFDLGLGEESKVYDESKGKIYGFKEFWKDLWAKR